MANADNNTEIICHFYRLPRELRDNVYSYAYANGRTVAITMGRLVCEAVTTPITESLVPRALCKDLHVDKRYLDEAFPVFIRGLTFKIDDVRNLETLGDKYSILQKNIRSASIGVMILVDREADADVTSIISAFPHLVNLAIRLPRRLFENEDIDTHSQIQMWYNETKPTVCLDILEAFEMELQEIRGLRHFEIEFECAHSWEKDFALDKVLQSIAEKIRLYVTLKPGQDIVQ